MPYTEGPYMLGEFLTTLRTSRGLSVPDVVERLGIPRSTAYAWEQPQSRPEPENLQALLNLYEATDEERLRAWELRAAGSAASAEAA